MIDFRDINEAVSRAETELSRVRMSAKQIGHLAANDMILKNMTGGQLAIIKRSLRDFNMKTWQWKN